MEHNDDERKLAVPVAGKSAMKKHSKATRHRLSELPDLAIVQILSHLYFEEAVRTSLLSKRFNSLWNSVSRLTFSDERSGKHGDVFVRFVEKALGFHTRSKIESFSVKFVYEPRYSKFVDDWIRFAVQKQVKSLQLDLVKNREFFVSFEHDLPDFLYECVSLVELVVSGCKFVEFEGIRWKSLKLLSITRIKLSEELISSVLDDCPVLETLELRDCRGFDRLKISSDSLKVLRIDGEVLPDYMLLPDEECLLEISGQNLVCLEVLGPLYRTKVRLSDVGSLVNATVDFEMRSQMVRQSRFATKFSVRDQDTAREVLESLNFVKALTVGGWFLKVLSTCETYNLSPTWSERKSLTLCIPVTKWDHLGISSLLHSSPYLETLVIRLSYSTDKSGLQYNSKNNQVKEYYWKSWSTISKCPLLHLKTLKVVNFQASSGNWRPLFQFIKFLLRNSKALEEIVIQTSQYVTREALDEALELLSVPAASPDAVLHFEPARLWVDPFCCQHVPQIG